VFLEISKLLYGDAKAFEASLRNQRKMFPFTTVELVVDSGLILTC